MRQHSEEGEVSLHETWIFFSPPGAAAHLTVVDVMWMCFDAMHCTAASQMCDDDKTHSLLFYFFGGEKVYRSSIEMRKYLHVLDWGWEIPRHVDDGENFTDNFSSTKENNFAALSSPAIHLAWIHHFTHRRHWKIFTHCESVNSPNDWAN